MNDYVIKALAYNKEVRIYVATSKHLVAKAALLHKTWPTASAALGRFITASAMMSLMYKDEERITLKINGDGPINYLLCEAYQGAVRADIGNPGVYLKYTKGPNKGKLNVGMAVGSGTLTITRYTKQNSSFASSSPLTTGEIADDFTYYFATSEQTPTSCGLGVLVNPDNTIKVSGGFIIQLLPNAKEETIIQIEGVLKDIKSVTTMLDNGKTPEDILQILASNTGVIIDKKEICYDCPCSKDNFKKSLETLNKETLDTMLKEDKKIEVTCHFCNSKYLFDEEEIKVMIDKK